MSDVRGRYIDADKLITTIDSSDELDAYSAITVCDLIKNAHTANVVEVCLCKDCKYRKFIDWGMGDCLHPNGSKHIAFDYHYCSYGERSEENVGD